MAPPVLRPTLFILQLVLCTCFAAGAFGAERKERDKAPLPKPPPQPVEQSLKVPRGETITIPLKIWGTQREPLQFLIRKPPMAGKRRPRLSDFHPFPCWCFIQAQPRI